MSTKAENRRFTVNKIVRHNATANDCDRELVTLIREIHNLLGYGSALTAALVDKAKEEALGVADASPDSDDSDTLHDKLPSGVGERKALGWAVRIDAGESCEEVASETYSNVGTVEDSVRLAAHYIELEIDSQEETGTEVT
jgi:hypothetical protein